MKPNLNTIGEHRFPNLPELHRMLCNIAEPPEDRLEHVVTMPLARSAHIFAPAEGSA